jgi:polar amino acid transport system permease protein
MQFHVDAIIENMPEILAGVRTTLVLTALAFLMGAVLGLAVALLRLSGARWVRGLAASYVSFFLATPVLVQLFWLYYVLPVLTDIRFSDMKVLVLTLGLNATAIMAENYRAGIQAIDPGQWDASSVLGLSRLQTLYLIVLPQAIRVVLPPIASTTISLLKDSSIATFIGVNDLLNIGRDVMIRTFRPIEIFTFVAFVYFLLTYPIAVGTTLLERRLRISSRG